MLLIWLFCSFQSQPCSCGCSSEFRCHIAGTNSLFQFRRHITVSNPNPTPSLSLLLLHMLLLLVVVAVLSLSLASSGFLLLLLLVVHGFSKCLLWNHPQTQPYNNNNNNMINRTSTTMKIPVPTPTVSGTEMLMMMKKELEFLKYKCPDRNTSLFPSPTFLMPSSLTCLTKTKTMMPITFAFSPRKYYPITLLITPLTLHPQLTNLHVLVTYLIHYILANICTYMLTVVHSYHHSLIIDYHIFLYASQFSSAGVR